MDSLIPPSKISNLTQGMFVDAVSDNFDERIKQKIFHAELVMDSAKVSAEMKTYKKIPVIAEFIDSDGNFLICFHFSRNFGGIHQSSAWKIFCLIRSSKLSLTASTNIP